MVSFILLILQGFPRSPRFLTSLQQWTAQRNLFRSVSLKNSGERPPSRWRARYLRETDVDTAKTKRQLTIQMLPSSFLRTTRISSSCLFSRHSFSEITIGNYHHFYHVDKSAYQPTVSWCKSRSERIKLTTNYDADG